MSEINNNMIRMLSSDGAIAVYAVDSTDIVREMEQVHATSAVVSAGLGRLLTAASLMGSQLKNPRDSLTLRVDGGGPAGVLVAVSDGEGNVRGYATHPVVELPLRPDGKLDVGGAVGRNGVLTVMKDLGMKEPYIGQIPLVSGEIGEDITAYYATSEQTPSVCALGVLVNPDLTIQKAGGYLLQLLPGTPEETIRRIEENVRKMPPVTQLLAEGYTPADMACKVLEGFAPKVLEERRVEYCCYCSREKTADILASLGREELKDMQAEDPTARVECHFCNRTYLFDISEITSNMR
ncbi:Hsp33 family molecular chaperone HslO [Ruminococcaceae bacterium OttesenSCG-928-O06]|nr:Hsp33 family molecular chaperone HslO [Ruminococcaceae bacterium OttesenSCG-928-O06]